MDEVKEDLLNRRFLLGAGEYGIMLAPNKCKILNFNYGFDNHYILDEYLVEELGLLSIGHIDTLSRIDYHMEREHGKGCYDMRLTQNSNNLRVFRYDNRRLNIDYTKVKYIDVTSADDMKEDLLTSNAYEYLDTYIILREDIKIKNKKMGYKNYKVITERR